MTISYLYIAHCIVASAENWDTNLRGANSFLETYSNEMFSEHAFCHSWMVDEIRLYPALCTEMGPTSFLPS